MIKDKLSIIIPFIKEHPQLAFTVQSLFCELQNKCDFEIIVVDNNIGETSKQTDGGSEFMAGLIDKKKPWYKYIVYDKKPSHWNAKNAGVAASDGEFLFFIDAHCIISQTSLIQMFHVYKNMWQLINGSIHLPISYLLEVPGRELIYKLIVDRENGIVHYSFTRQTNKTTMYQVPCMSTCGMMIHRSIYNRFEGWPEELGAYNGGEQFFNFTLATMGFKINIFPHGCLYHYAAPRGYEIDPIDYHRNRCIATYMFGGEEWARRYINFAVPESVNEIILQGVFESEKCIRHHNLIRSRQSYSIDEWLDTQEVHK